MTRCAIVRAFLALTVVGALAAQAATAQMFQKTYDDLTTYASVSQCVRQTTDGGYITAGYSYYWGGALSVLLSKTTSTGALVWTKELVVSNQLGTPSALGLAVREIVTKSATSGYVIVGTTREVSGTNDVLVIKTSATGTELSRNTYQGSGEDVAYNVEVIPDQVDSRKKNFVITGYTGAQEVSYIDPVYGLSSAHKGQKIFLARLDDNFAILWWKHYGVTFPLDPAKEEWAAGYAVNYLPTSGDLVVTGFTDPTGRVNGLDKVPFVLRATGNGTLLWANQYLVQVDPYLNLDRYAVGKAVRETSDGGLIVTGIMMDYPATMNGPWRGQDIFLLKLTSAGLLNWMYAYNTSFDGSNYNEGGYDVYQASDGDYVVAGRTNYYEGAQRTMLMKVASNGQSVRWAYRYMMRVIGAPYTITNVDNDEMGITMHPSSDGGYIIESKPYPNSPDGLYLLKTDANGRTGGCEEPFALEVVPLNPVPASVDEFTEQINSVSIIPATDPKDYTEESCGATKRSIREDGADFSQNVLVHPNVLSAGSPLQIRCDADPGSPVTVTVGDVLGRTVYSGEPTTIAPGESISIDTENWIAGTYFVRIVSQNYTETRSLVVE